MARSAIPPRVWNELHPAVGLLVLNWAMFESSIEMWTAIFYHQAGGKKLNARIPREYKRKVRFIRDCFSSLPCLSPFKTTGIQCLDKAAPLSKVRYSVTHGAISDYETETKRVLFIRLDVNATKSIHVASNEWLSVRDILQASHASTQLARTALTLGHRLSDAFP